MTPVKTYPPSNQEAEATTEEENLWKVDLHKLRGEKHSLLTQNDNNAPRVELLKQCNCVVYETDCIRAEGEEEEFCWWTVAGLYRR